MQHFLFSLLIFTLPFCIALEDTCDATLPHPSSMNKFRHPVVVVSHGPGPLWLLKNGFHGQNRDCEAARNVASIFDRLYPTGENLPKRILFVSAHWESYGNGFEISKSSAPDMIYDYGGFPRESYEIVYGAKGDPAFAQRVNDILSQHQLASKLVERGYDHGVFVPMFLIRPAADIPIVTVSINDRLDAKAHFELGRALATVRDEDTMIICSGQATHNLRGGFDEFASTAKWALEFQDWLDTTLSTQSELTFDQRRQQLVSWKYAPSAKLAHPTPDHFTPFVVAAGAGMEEEKPGAEKLFGGWGAGQLSFATYAWGINK